MSMTYLKKTRGGTVAVLGAALALLLPSAASATITQTATVGSTVAGPSSTFAEVSSHADCGSGLISGGGIFQTTGTGMSSNGLRTIGMSPSSNGTAEYTGSTGVVGTDVTHWLGIGSTGGMTNPAFDNTPYAMCFTSSIVNHTQIIMNKLANQGTVTAACPANTRLLGGGARATPASIGSFKPIASFPTYDDGAHSNGAISATDGDVNPDSWTAVGANGGNNGSLTTYAYAVCSGNGIDVSGLTVTVRFSEAGGPTGATAGQKVETGCGANDGTLLSGGAAISGGAIDSTGWSLPGSQGDHLNGSYPSDGSQAPTTSSPTHWTAYTHTGGSGSPSTFSDVWALCGDE